jgi:hypothetical protein
MFGNASAIANMSRALNDLKSEIELLKSQQIEDKIVIRKMIGEAIVDLMNGTPDEVFDRRYYWPSGYQNTFKAKVQQMASATAEPAAIYAIKVKVESEEFIDNIIERIKRKQL